MAWQAALVDPGRSGGWALLHCQQRFLCGRRGRCCRAKACAAGCRR